MLDQDFRFIFSDIPVLFCCIRLMLKQTWSPGWMKLWKLKT